MSYSADFLFVQWTENCFGSSTVDFVFDNVLIYFASGQTVYVLFYFAVCKKKEIAQSDSADVLYSGKKVFRVKHCRLCVR